MNLNAEAAQALASLLQSARDNDLIITRDQICRAIPSHPNPQSIANAVLASPSLSRLNRNAAQFLHHSLSPKGLALRSLHHAKNGIPRDKLISSLLYHFASLSQSNAEKILLSPDFTLQDNLVFSSKKLALQADSHRQIIINLFASLTHPISLSEAYYLLFPLGFSISLNSIINTAYHSDLIVPVRVDNKQLWIHKKLSHLYSQIIPQPDQICQFLNTICHNQLKHNHKLEIPKKNLVQLIQNNFQLTPKQAAAWLAKISPSHHDPLILSYRTDKTYFSLKKRDIIRQTIHHIARQILLSHYPQWLEKKYLYLLIHKQFPCNIHSFYAYLKSMPDIEHKRSGKSYLCRLKSANALNHS
ncbi:MAG: hypothetical protein NZM04_00455 [Methylacidiphilales bacterium]|nr:hypothetical protein [Candidatus Methylacidiphilales bacterium]